MDVRTVATALSVVSLIVAPPLRGHTEPPDERGQTATALALFGAKRGLLVSSRGALRISRDGGASWQPAGRFAVTGLFPVSASVGFATSKRGLLRTDDAGRNWRLILRSSGNPSFADPRHGWIDGPKPQATDDDGRTWQRIELNLMPADGSFDFVTPLVGYVGGWVTTDGGRDWKLVG